MDIVFQRKRARPINDLGGTRVITFTRPYIEWFFGGSTLDDLGSGPWTLFTTALRRLPEPLQNRIKDGASRSFRIPLEIIKADVRLYAYLAAETAAKSTGIDLARYHSALHIGFGQIAGELLEKGWLK